MLHEDGMWLRNLASPRFDRELTEFLNEYYEGQLIRRFGPVTWDALSPDVNRTDLVLWGGVKSLAHRNGKSEARYQLLGPTNEAVFVISNEVGRFQ